MILNFALVLILVCNAALAVTPNPDPYNPDFNCQAQFSISDETEQILTPSGQGCFYYMLPPSTNPTNSPNKLALSSTSLDCTMIYRTFASGATYQLYRQNVQVLDATFNVLFDYCVAKSKAPLMTNYYIANTATTILLLSSYTSAPISTYVHYNKFLNVVV